MATAQTKSPNLLPNWTWVSKIISSNFREYVSKYCLQYLTQVTRFRGLQECLNKLGTYCNKWELQVNLKKTKIILFNRQGSLIKNTVLCRVISK